MDTHTQSGQVTDYIIGVLGSPDPLIKDFFTKNVNEIIYCNPVKFSFRASQKHKKLPLNLLSIIKLLNKLVFLTYENKPKGFLILNSDLLYHNRFDLLLNEYLPHIPNETKTCLFSYNITKWSVDGKTTCPWVWEKSSGYGLCKLDPKYAQVINGSYSFWISLEHARELVEEGLSLDKTIDEWLITDSSIFTYPLMSRNKNRIFNGWPDKYHRLDYRPGLVLKKIVSTDTKNTIRIEIKN